MAKAAETEARKKSAASKVAAAAGREMAADKALAGRGVRAAVKSPSGGFEKPLAVPLNATATSTKIIMKEYDSFSFSQVRQSTSITGCVRCSVGRLVSCSVTHFFDDQHGAPY